MEENYAIGGNAEDRLAGYNIKLLKLSVLLFVQF